MKIRKIISRIAVGLAMSAVAFGGASEAQAFDWLRAAQGGIKLVQSATITDAQIEDYVRQYVADLDKKSNVAGADNPYTVRLNKITKGITKVGKTPLNFKVYITKDVNAFACADGSVRVYSGLMDIMDDDEVLGVIGHEIGHVAHHDTRNAMKSALRTSALRDALSSTSGWVAVLSDSQLGAIGEVVLNNSYSKKQESNADNYGYEFLKQCGRNPWAMAEAFSRLGSMEGGTASSYVKQLFSDHPETKKRIQAMEKRAIADGYPVPAGYTPLTPGVKASTSTATQTNTSAKKTTGKTTTKTTAKKTTKKTTSKKK